MMNNVISFGKHKGRTFEWLFFKAGGYARWLYKNGIHLQESRFTPGESDRFLGLYERASNLGGTCCRCHERLVTRMGSTTSFKHGELLAVGFYCDECEHLGGAQTGYYHPSFFEDAYTLESWEHQMILNEIKRHYIGSGNLTQKRMAEFFGNGANFALPAPAEIAGIVEVAA